MQDELQQTETAQARQDYIVCWWSGGVTSAVACQIAIEMYGLDRCRLVFIDTHNEGEDCYRFLADCEKWYGKKIETLSAIPSHFKNIQEVWEKYGGLNMAGGTPCSLHLKRRVRERWEHTIGYDHQVFGFHFDKREFKRAWNLKLNNEHTKPIFPLLMFGMDKEYCLRRIQSEGIELPESYRLGFANANCLNTGCVQGSFTYWQKMHKEYPEKYKAMADIEHKLTDAKGKPVTMLRKEYGSRLTQRRQEPAFLLPHKDYPNLKCVLDIRGTPMPALLDCNGFCGTDDGDKDKIAVGKELNYDLDSEVH